MQINDQLTSPAILLCLLALSSLLGHVHHRCTQKGCAVAVPLGQE